MVYFVSFFEFYEPLKNSQKDETLANNNFTGSTVHRSTTKDTLYHLYVSISCFFPFSNNKKNCLLQVDRYNGLYTWISPHLLMRRRNFFAEGRWKNGVTFRPMVYIYNNAKLLRQLWPTWRKMKRENGEKGGERKAPTCAKKSREGRRRRKKRVQLPCEGSRSSVCIAYSRYVYYSPSPLLFFLPPL